MKGGLTILLFFIIAIGNAQIVEDKLTTTVKEFHQALVSGNTISINQQTDKALTYGHSNGWVETKSDVIKDLETGYINYNSFKEDSIGVLMNGNVASVRFVADINVTLKGTTSNFHLKVLGSVGKEREEMVVVCKAGGERVKVKYLITNIISPLSG